MNRWIIFTMAFLFAGLPSFAQSASARSERPAALELALAYSADRMNAPPGGCSCFWMRGGKAEINANLYRNIGLVAELAGEHADNTNAAHDQLSFISYLIGPRYTVRASHRLVPFAQVLVGGIHGFDAFFPNQNGSANTPDGFAMAAGGGLNVGLSRHLAIRAVQADYLLTKLPNNINDRQNHLRLAAGIVFRFHGR